MNSRNKYLMIIPLYGAIIILLILYIRTLLGKINKKLFFKLLFLCGIFGGISIYFSNLFLKIISVIFSIEIFMNSYRVLFAMILGGYLMNFYTYKVVNKNYDKLVIIKQ